MWVERKPEGETSFTAMLNSNATYGFDSAYCRSETPMQAVKDMISREAGHRNPGAMRNAKSCRTQGENPEA